MKQNVKMKNYLFAIMGVVSLVILDQYTKFLAILNLKDQDAFVIWDGVFELHYLENRGMAFGMLQNQRIFFLIMTIVVMFFVIVGYMRTPLTKRFLPMRLSMIILAAGAIGNFIDRVCRGYVVDFLYFSLIDFPIFNVADIYVTLAFCMLVFLLLIVYKEKELSVYSIRKKADKIEKVE